MVLKPKLRTIAEKSSTIGDPFPEVLLRLEDIAMFLFKIEDRNELRSESRQKRLVSARQCVWYMANKSDADISAGRLAAFYGRDRSTVLYGVDVQAGSPVLAHYIETIANTDAPLAKALGL